MKRLISLLCTLALALTLVGPAMTAHAVGGGQKRVIDIVYDDSGSMCGDDRWSQALYAMEVFATMLGEEDEMNVFLMSDYGSDSINVKGSDPKRVEQIVGSLGNYDQTPFSTVTSAGAHITGVDSSVNRWLVVLTDGSFNGTSSSQVERTLTDYANQGIQVAYLALTSNANIVLQGDPTIGFYAYSATGNAQILPCITEIANQIFQQQVLPASHITVNGSTMTLDVDIPLSQLLIFAQGDGITVSNMTLDGAALTATETHQVEVTDANKPPNYATAMAADGLRGVVQTYTAGGSPYAKGTYEFTVSDTSNVEVYYIAGADIDCHLTYNGVEVKDNEKHYAGEYGVSMRFLDPLTGEELQSDLLDGAVFTAEVINGADVKTIDSNTLTIYLQEGEVELNAWAELPGNVTVRSSHKYTVYPEPIQLDISAQLPSEYSHAALGDQAQPILITVINHTTGEKLSQEEWDAIGDNLQVSSSSAVNWIVRRGSEVSTWEIWPDYVTDMSDTATGDVELTVKAAYEMDLQAASGAETIHIYIAPYVSSELKVEITPPEAPIPLNDLANTKGALVTLYTKNVYTGEYDVLTADQAQLVDFTLEAEALNWELRPGDKAGTWYLKPKDDAALITFSDDSVVVVVSGVLTEDVLVYQGSGSEELAVIPLTTLEKILRLLPYIIGGMGALFLLIGYTFGKKKLRIKRIEPYVENVSVRPRNRLTVKYRKIWWSYLLPYVAQRATFVSHQPVFNCKFANVTIKAAGGTFFYITNIRAFVGKNTKIDGEFVDAKADKKKKYSLSSTISSHDAKTKRPAGEFHFV